MTILTLAEAAAVLRLAPVPDDDNPDIVLNIALAGVDDFLKTATGYDWSTDATIDPTAKMAASMLLVQFYENPAMIGGDVDLPYGVTSRIEQLRVKAQR